MYGEHKLIDPYRLLYINKWNAKGNKYCEMAKVTYETKTYIHVNNLVCMVKRTYKIHLYLY